MSGISHLELGHGIIEQFLFPPLTATGWYDPSKLRETIYAAREIFEKHGEKFSIRLLPEHMIPVIEEALPGKMIFKDDRANHDYVYLKKDLIDLKGRKYHRKKNHLNYFHNNYEYEYVPLTSGMKDEVVPRTAFQPPFKETMIEEFDGKHLVEQNGLASGNVFSDPFSEFGAKGAVRPSVDRKSVV